MAAILFDADGVLLDSMRCYQRAWSSWATIHGIPGDAVWRIAPGRRPRDIISIAAPDLSAESEVLRFAQLLDKALVDVKPMPGAQELLARLTLARWCIVTSAYKSHLLAALRTARLPTPRVLVAGEDVDHGKPAPDSYLRAARRLRALVAECVVVEDSPAGIAAAKAAGMTCVAVATTHPEQFLAAADHTFVSLAAASDHIVTLACETV